jgi:hypothetical protein
VVKIYSRDYWRPAISDSKGNYFQMTKRGPRRVNWLPWEHVASYLRRVAPIILPGLVATKTVELPPFVVGDSSKSVDTKV